jgi:hypothetical protein
MYIIPDITDHDTHGWFQKMHQLPYLWQYLVLFW